jgi:hypothetical protein
VKLKAAFRLAGIATALCVAGAAGRASALDLFSFEGDTVTGELTGPSYYPVVEQFAPTAVVGPGVEFTGILGTGDPHFDLGVAVDITGRTLEVSLFKPPGTFGDHGYVPFTITVGNLDFTSPEKPAHVAGIRLLTTPTYCICQFPDNELSWTNDSVTIPYYA